MLQGIVVAVMLASPRVAAAQQYPERKSGCLTDQAEQVAANIQCGQRSMVTFAVEQYGASADDLQEWLQDAGCSMEEARIEAFLAAARCQLLSTSVGKDNPELRGTRRKRHQLAGKRYPGLSKRDGSSYDLAMTTLGTSPNKYAMTWMSKSGSATVTSIVTCMTEVTTTTRMCSTKTEAGKTTQACDNHAPTIYPTCVDGYSGCKFASDTGNISCYKKDGIPTFGFITMGIMAVVALFLVGTFCGGCCADRRRAKQRKEAALLASLVEDKRGMAPGTTPAGVEDARPLMAATQTGPHDPFTDAARSH